MRKINKTSGSEETVQVLQKLTANETVWTNLPILFGEQMKLLSKEK